MVKAEQPKAAAGATLDDKLRAASALGIVASNELLVLSDRNFVFALWRQAKGAEVRASAELALGGTDADCTTWIKLGIHDAVKRDQAKEQRDAEAARIARELKRNAAMMVGIEPTAEMLVLGYKDFVYDLWKRVSGPKVKAAALEAFGKDEAAQKAFLAEGIRKAHEQDQLDAIEKNQQATEAEKARQKARAAKQRAMRQVLGVEPTEGMLELSDDNFIREVWNRAKPDTEVQTASVAALRSSDPAVWKRFIDTGIYEANNRDKANELRKQEEADKRRLLEIQTKAEKSLVHPELVDAAKAALAAGPEGVSWFLRIGQYGAALIQSLQSDTLGVRGWYIRNGSDGHARIEPGKPVPGPGVGADANWRVVPGLADTNCHSLEAADRPGVYLRQENLRVLVAQSDGSEQFRRDATWCSHPGLQGAGVSLESLSAKGRFLRHINSELWAANKSGENWFDNPNVFEPDASWRMHGSNPVSTGILLRWLNDESLRGRVGNPVEEEKADGDVRWRNYQQARLYWTGATGAQEIRGAIRERYDALGAHKSGLGVPITDELTTPDGIGRFNHLNRHDGASIYWSPETGARAVYGTIRERWASLGWERSYLGYPTGEEKKVGDLVVQEFQNGRIEHDPRTGRTTDIRK
ncbi:LGFP repeat-containing protein [Streptoalloteichus hindustanus]|uniref:LGFP repeat-containing protein n=3 Tax=Streptoalloteichus hindustanus TaxID=2017 RepID=A0A1M5BPU9_STRHI|nr:LGFP repeat-containing protein [Streptoalloteichus hindustanus]